MTRLPRLAAAAASLALAATGALAGPAPAHGGHAQSRTTLAHSLLTPLRAAAGHHGTVYVTENFAGKIVRVGPGRRSRVIYTDPHHNEVGGVSVAGRDLIFTVTSHDPNNPEGNLDSWLKRLTPSGHVRTIANLHRYEAKKNPDRVNTYGFRHIAADCASQWPQSNGPASYSGMVDSHPYSTFVTRHWIYVGDAGANDVLAVSPHGAVRTVAVLPGIPFKITKAAASGLGLPDCFVGLTYWFEPVPTDVEMGPGRHLYVSSLPGGPEGPQLGGRGSVFRVARWHHHVRRVVAGLVDPTGVAVAPGGLYVAELFGNKISKVTFRHHRAHVRTFASVKNPGEVEWSPRGLIATTHVLAGSGGHVSPAGRLMLFRVHGHR